MSPTQTKQITHLICAKYTYKSVRCKQQMENCSYQIAKVNIGAEVEYRAKSREGCRTDRKLPKAISWLPKFVPVSEPSFESEVNSSEANSPEVETPEMDPSRLTRRRCEPISINLHCDLRAKFSYQPFDV